MRATIIYWSLLIAPGLVLGCSTTQWSRTSADSKPASAGDVAAKADGDSSKTAKADSKPAEGTAVAEKPAADKVAAEKPSSEKPAAESIAKVDDKPAATTATSTAAAAATPATTEPAKDTEASQSIAVTAVAADDSPFQSSRPTEAADVNLLAKTGGKASGTPRELNKELLLLIDKELRDATPEERIEWFDQLKHVDAAVIPEILRARRMSLQLARQTSPEQPDGLATGVMQTAATNPMSSMTSGGQPAPSQPSATSATIAARAGMGWGSPWGATSPGGAGTSPDPFSAVPAGQSSTAVDRGPIPAHYQQSASNNLGGVEHAVMRPTLDGQLTTNGQLPTNGPLTPNGGQSGAVLLLNHELPAGSAAANSGQSLPNAGSVGSMGSNMATAPGSLAPNSNPNSGVPWPPARPAPETASGLNSVTSHLPFGSNLVQNMVGLVPGRGTSPSPGPVVPVNAIQPVSTGFPEHLAEATSYLEQELASLAPGASPEGQAEYVRKHVALRLLYLMGNHQERALTAIPGIAPAEQEFWQQLMWGMVNALDAKQMPDARQRATQTISQLNQAIRRLQEQAELQVRNVAFCHQILYFGNYEKLPRNEFSPGQEVLLYAEIDHFKSEPTSEGQYRTLLRSTIELLSPNGELRKQIEFPATEDLCSTYRRDYFHNYQFRIPERMPLGPQVLKLTVFDELSGKLISYTTNFVVK